MTTTCDICGRTGVKHQQLGTALNTRIPGSVAHLRVWPSQLSLCYFCVRETLLQLLKQSEKLSDVASVNRQPQ